MKCSLLSRPMTCTHDWISRVVLPGDTVVDATAGNGHDTVFLARLAGPSGQVHAFDVQEEAIRATRERLEKEGLLTSAVHLHLASHDRLAELVTGPVKAVGFNLGYLPGGDKKTITRTGCTLAALEQAAALIAPNGLLSVIDGDDGDHTDGKSSFLNIIHGKLSFVSYYGTVFQTFLVYSIIIRILRKARWRFRKKILAISVEKE